ncbi:cell envelope integrity protein TolA [Taklimakanibacter deserti]|uniref:cell envelope integrity protein TolA n=1 Tax=Taklimakanibacter deserti TaxID=2267839 RepID=UPI000E64BBF0
MNTGGLSHGSRLVCIILAVGVHAAAAAAFMLTPKMEPPPPPEGVEIEMLAEITSVVAEEVPPSVAAEAEQIEQVTETQPGEAASMDGEVAEAVASLETKPTEVMPPEVEDTAEPEVRPEAVEPEAQPEAEDSPEVEDSQEAEEPQEAETPPEEAPVTMPIELEEPKVATPQAPALATKPKAEAKKAEARKTEGKKTEKKVAKKKAKAQPRRLAVAGSTLAKEATRKGQSSAQSSGGRRSSSEYRSIVQARLSARRSAISTSVGSGRVIIAFAIGASGRITSASISQSSGNSRLDSAARSVVAATSFPPPPAGSYRGRIPISVSVR